MNMSAIDPKILEKSLDLNQTVSGPQAVQYSPALQQEFDNYVDHAKLNINEDGVSKDMLKINDHEMQVLKNAIHAFQSNETGNQGDMGFQQASVKVTELSTAQPTQPNQVAPNQASYDPTSFMPDTTKAGAEQIQSFKIGEPLPASYASSNLPEPIQALADALVKFRSGYKQNLNELSDALSKNADEISQTDIMGFQTKIATMNVYATIFANSESSIIGTLKQFLSSSS